MIMKTKDNTVLVSVINWNNSKATNRCLKSVVDQSIKSSILVTDNNSEIEVLKLDDELGRCVKLVKNDINTGFAAAHNKAIDYAVKEGFDYILLMNNDAYFSGRDDLFNLVNCAVSNSADAVAPLIVQEENIDTVWYAGGGLNKKLANTRHYHSGDTIHGVPNEISEVSFLTGCTLLLKVSGSHKLDDKYFLYWEDADWCAKASTSNKKLIFCPHSKVIHRTSSSLGLRSPIYAYYNIRNRLLFARKWSRLTFPFVLFSNMYISLKYIVNSAVHDYRNLPKMILLVIRAQVHGLIGRGGSL